MIHLKKIRKGLNLSQYDIAKALGCTQAFISQIENSRNEFPLELEDKLFELYGKERIIELNRDPVMRFMGLKDELDPEYSAINDELIYIVNTIKKLKGFSPEEISKLIYRKNDVIPLAIRSHAINPNMPKYILKRIEKLGLTADDLKIEEYRKDRAIKVSSELINGKNDFFINEFAPFDKIQFVPSEIDCYIKSPIDFAPKFKMGSILGLKEVGINEVKYGKLYLIILEGNQYQIKYLSVGVKKNKITTSYEFPPKNIHEITTNSINRLFHVVISINIQKV